VAEDACSEVMKRPWTSSYDKHVPPTVDVPDIYLHDFVRESARRHPHAPALTYFGRTITYSELEELIERAAGGLEELGVREGDRVALILPDTPTFVALAYGAMSLGAAVVPFYALWSPAEVADAIRRSSPKLIVVQDVLLPRLRDVLQASKVPTFVSMIEDLSSARMRLTASLGRLLGKLPRVSGFRRASELFGERLEVRPKASPSELVAAMMFTGGTTGVPKLAALTHRNIASNVYFQKVWFNRKEASDRAIGVLPFFHVYGFGSILALTLTLAAHMVLMPRFDPMEFHRNVLKYNVNLIPGAPTLYLALLKALPQGEMAKWRGVVEMCFSGASPLPVEAINRLESITGCRVVEGYGLTETSPVIAANPLYGKRKVGSIGLPMPGTLMAVADPEEPRLLPRGSTGEIVVSGPQVMMGYVGGEENPFFEACGLRWLRTGDIGYADEEWFFYIVDRKKDVIKYKGHSVYPRMIEEALYRHPCVAEAAVIGVPDEVVGENIKAFIALRPECKGKVREEDMIEWAKKELGGHEYPRLVEFRDELPKNLAGKILRRALREEELRRLREQVKGQMKKEG